MKGEEGDAATALTVISCLPRHLLAPPSDIAVPEWLIPPAVDEDGEILPSEQHPSRPLGDPYALTYTTPYASQPKLSPRLHMHASLFSSGPTAAAAAALEASAPLRSLPNHLALRAATTHAPRPPTWPFRQFGPGPRNASFYSSGPAPPLRQVWADLALESLLPRGNEKDPIKDQVDADRANLTPEAAAAGIPKSAGDRLASLELAIFGYDQAVKFKKENEEKIAGGVWTGSEPEPQPQPQPQRAAPWRWGDS